MKRSEETSNLESESEIPDSRTRQRKGNLLQNCKNREFQDSDSEEGEAVNKNATTRKIPPPPSFDTGIGLLCIAEGSGTLRTPENSPGRNISK